MKFNNYQPSSPCSYISNYQQEEKHSKEKNLLASFLHYASYLTFHRQLRKPPFNVAAPSTIHSSMQISSIAQCKFVLHNKQTNKTPYPCIPCRSDRVILAVGMQKVDGIENKQTKERNPKNSLCSHYQSDFLSGHIGLSHTFAFLDVCYVHMSQPDFLPII